MDTYKIIGGDGREYGPEPLDELRSWIRDGRVGKDTLVWRSDTSAWLPAARYLELESELRQLYGGSTRAETGLRRAGFWLRLGAYLLDRLVLWVAFTVLWSILARALQIEQPAQQTVLSMDDLFQYMNDIAPFVMKQMAIYLPLHLAYDVFLNGRFGATLGKMAMGLKIVRLDGGPISYGTAALRWIGARLSDLFCYAGYLFIVVREDKRALHDLMAKTQVVHKA